MPSEAVFSIKFLRKAAKDRADETSIRTVAEEIGMSSSGFHLFLKGSDPHPSTRAKLVAWHLERQRATRSGDTVGKADVDAAILLLAHYIRGASREDARVLRAAEIARRLAELADAP